MTEKRKRRLSELELKRRQLLDQLLEVEKSPTPRKKGMLREIYWEMFGGLPQDMIPEDRISSLENEEQEISTKNSEKKQAEPKKKSTGFFGAVKSIFKSSTKADPKQDKKNEAQNNQGPLARSMVMGSPIYHNDPRDERFKELSSPSEYDTRIHRKTEVINYGSARLLDSSTGSTTGIGGSFDQRQRSSTSLVNTTKGHSKAQ